MNAMVIIGAGECGTRAAFALRENGWTGPVTLIGSEAGLPYERPPLSKPGEAGVPRKPICDAAALDAAGIDYRPGIAVRAIDTAGQSLSLTDGSDLFYHRLLLATGARPRRLTCPGSEHVLDFRTHADAERIFARCAPDASVAIIGAGLIGMELAAVLSAKGIAVQVIEAGAAPLGRAVPPHLAARIHARHCDEGVQFHFGCAIAAISDQGVILGDGRLIAADLVVGAIGVLPETGLAEAAGLAIGNGILTDTQLQTSAPGIFAAGDCAAFADGTGGHTRLESWQNARDQAEAAARNMLGADLPFIASPWFWSDQYELGLQVAGIPRPGDQMVLRPLPGQGEIAFYLRDGQLIAAAGLGTGNSVAKDIRLAGMLIAAGAAPDPAALADPSVHLKALLKTARAA